MTALWATRGLPASGKSTWARGWVAEDPERRARVNQDDLRAMLCLGEWTRAKETRVAAVRLAAIGALLSLGLDVVADDTNLAPTAIADLRGAARRRGAEFREYDLTGVPLETCIARDAARADGVGEDVIRSMHDRYLA